MKGSWKRWMIAVSTVIITVSMVVGCTGNKAVPENSQSSEPDTQAFKGKSITLFLANHPWGELLKQQLPEFEKSTGMKVNVQSFFEDQLDQKVSVQLTANTDTPDVFMYRPWQQTMLYSKNGWIQNLDDFVNQDKAYDFNDFSKAVISSTTVDGKVYGIPIVTEREILYYRKDILEKANIPVPKTIDELVNAAKKLNDPKNKFYGFAARGQRSPLITQLSSFLYSEGGDWLDGGKAAINTPQAVKAFTTYGTLLKDYGPPGALNFSWPQAIGLLAQGNVAFVTEADSVYTNAIDPEKSQVADQIGYAQFPAGQAGSRPTNAASWALTMNSNSVNKDAAWAFIQWATSKEMMLKLQQKGIPGSRSSVFEHPDSAVGFPPQLYEVMKASIKVGVPYDRPIVVNVGESRDVIGEIVQRVMTGETNVQELADKANTAFQAIIDKGNR